MLQDNPITIFMYEYGYDGVEDIYDYWFEHKDDIIQQFKLYHPEYNFAHVLEEFEHIVRWHAVYGIFFRFEVTRYCRTHPHTSTSLDDITIKTGRTYLQLMDYSRKTQLYPQVDHRVDLRGFSLVGSTIKNVIFQHINFDYASFFETTFENVVFEDCSFQYSNFERTRLKNCRFDKYTIFRDNNFSKALLSSRFYCQIPNPTVEQMDVFFLTKRRIKKYIEYPPFTIITDFSFVEQTNSNEIEALYNEEYKFRRDAKYKGR